MNLTVRIVDRVESEVLGVELVKLVKKLRDILKSRFVTQMEEFGLKKSREVAEQAVKWGYSAARIWVQDLEFIRYLTFQKISNNFL